MESILCAAAKVAFYTALVAFCIHYRLIFGSNKWKAYEEWLTRQSLRFMAAHGIAVPTVFWLFQGAGISDWVHTALYLAGIPLMWLLWDGGKIHRMDPKFLLFVSLHHLGCFIAYPYQASETPERAWRNTAMFGWLWLIHSFGFIQQLLAHLGYERAKGESTWGLTRMREAYSAVSVYLFYQYMAATGQPGLGWNYQTFSLVLMLIGRYLANDNAWQIPFLRRVEVPGAIWVFSSLLCGDDLVLGACVTALAYLGLLMRKVQSPPPKVPSGWDPQHKEIEKVLAKWEKKFNGMIDKDDKENGDGALEPSVVALESKNVKGVSTFLASKPEWQEKYPIIMAVAVNDFTKLKKLVSAGGDVNTKMSDWWDSDAAGWAFYLGRLSCALHLIQNGANPYESQPPMGNYWDAAKREGITQLTELQEDIDPVALQAFPPANLADWESMGAFEKAWKVIANF